MISLVVRDLSQGRGCAGRGAYSTFGSRASSRSTASRGLTPPECSSASMAAQIGICADRHLHAVNGRQSYGLSSGGHAFGDMTEIGKYRRERFAGGKREPDPPVAGQIPGTGQDQIAHSGQAHQGFGLAAACLGQACSFGQAACDQCGARIEAETQPVRHAGRDCDDILDPAAQFGANQISAPTRSVLA